MTARHLPIVAALLFACGTSETEQPEAPFTQTQAAHLEAMVGNFVTSQGYPNLAIGVVMGNDLVWQAGFGTGARLGAKPDADTIFRAGSVTKLVTSTALVALAEDGVLSLDDEAAAWLPEAQVVLSPEGSPPVTLRHLISHSSGLPVESSVVSSPHDDFTEAEVLAALDGVELLFEPGAKHSYSNLGTSLAGMVISRASGKPFRSFVQERVLDPLEMHHSVWDKPSSGLAPAYGPGPRGGYERSDRQFLHGALEPQGGLFTTVRDLASLAGHGLGFGSILSSAALAESQTPVSNSPDDLSYGLGWLIDELPWAGKLAWHDSIALGYGATLAVLPDHGIGVVILMGSSFPGDVEEIQSLALATLAYLLDPETDVVPEQSVTSPAGIEVVAGRLLGLLSAPTPALLTETFTPSFFELIPEADLLSYFDSVSKAAGGCSTWSTAEDRGLGAFLLDFDCAGGSLFANVRMEPDDTHQLYGFYLFE